MIRSATDRQHAAAARGTSSTRITSARLPIPSAVACLLFAVVVLLWPDVSFAEVDPLTGLYRLQQADLGLHFLAIELVVTRQFDSALAQTDLDQDGWTFRQLDKRIVLADEDRVFLQNGAEVTEFVRDGDKGDYACHRNERMVASAGGLYPASGDGARSSYTTKRVRLTACDTPGQPVPALRLCSGTAGHDLRQR